MNKFSKMKVHWWTYNHCLFVSYLTSVTLGYGWISDIKFQKFSDKDWIWIFKKFIEYGSGVKKSISTHLCYDQRNKSALSCVMSSIDPAPLLDSSLLYIL